MKGLHNMNPEIPKSKAAQLVIIWSITCVATCSVLSGVGYGIRRISEICFCIGLSLMFSVLVLGIHTVNPSLYASDLCFRQHRVPFESLCSIPWILSAVDDSDRVSHRRLCSTWSELWSRGKRKACHRRVLINRWT